MAEKGKGRFQKWVKGQSGNPSGRPKSYFNFRKELENKLTEVNPDDPQGRTYGRMMIDKAVDAAIGSKTGAPSIRALSEVLDRFLGKPAQSVNLDANFNVTREERVAHILERLDALSPSQDKADARPGCKQVN